MQPVGAGSVTVQTLVPALGSDGGDVWLPRRTTYFARPEPGTASAASGQLSEMEPLGFGVAETAGRVGGTVSYTTETGADASPRAEPFVARTTYECRPWPGMATSS